jgi:hypothetical protein
MNRLLFGFVGMTALMVGLPLQAQGRAAPADVRYCAALSDLYMRYIGNPEQRPGNVRRSDIEADTAVAQCRAGDTAIAIPVLERKLTANKFTLPARE